jgi:hypothetical protein
VNDKLQNFSPADADLVMLTHKNEYANWITTNTAMGLVTMNDFQKTSVETFVEEKDNKSSFKISGTVLNRSKEPVAKKIITIFSKQNNSHFSTDTTDTNGSFQFYFTELNDSAQFVVQVSNLKGIKEEKYTVVFDTVSMPHFITPGFLKKKFVFDEKSQKIIKELLAVDSVRIGNGIEWLKPVIIKRYKKKEVTYDESKRVSPFSHIITQEMIGYGGNMAGNALLRVPRVHLAGNTIAIGAPSISGGKITYVEPLIVLDGVPMPTDTSSGGLNVLAFVNSIPVSSIDFIEVLTGPEGAIYGMQGGNGVILINTTSRPRINQANLSGLSSFYPRGFHMAQSFIMPDYNNKEMKASKVPDLRTTIYWNSNIISNKEGKASVNFFTADTPANYLITITGISENGDKIYKTYTINRNLAE